MILLSRLIDLVANSTPIVDFDSRLNSLRVKRESTDESVNVSKEEQRREPTIPRYDS
jgi:hypothetical protein